MPSPDNQPTPETQNVSADTLRSEVRKIYTNSSSELLETVQTLIAIFADELRKEYGKALYNSPFWHSLTLSGQKNTTADIDEVEVRVINKKIKVFYSEKLASLTMFTNEPKNSELAASIMNLKSDITQLSDSGLGEHYLSQVTELVLDMQKRYTFPLTAIQEIDMVIGGGSNNERAHGIDEVELTQAKKEFFERYSKIHETFVNYFLSLK